MGTGIVIIMAIGIVFILCIVLGRWILGIYLLHGELKKTNAILSDNLFKLTYASQKQTKAIEDLLSRIG